MPIFDPKIFDVEIFDTRKKLKGTMVDKNDIGTVTEKK